MMRRKILGAALALPAFALAAGADVVLPGDPDWTSTGNTGGGSSVITSTFVDQHGGNGSLELTGDRTRFQSVTGNYGLLSGVEAFTFEWAVAGDSTTSNPAANAYYTPAIRLLIADPGWDPTAPEETNANHPLTELIWEGAYNGVNNLTRDTWYTTSSGDDFWRWETSNGVTRINGTISDPHAQANLTISEWSTGTDTLGGQWFSDQAYIYAVSIGVGSSVGAGYHAFADYLTLTVNGVTTVFDFETAAAVVPVPPAAAIGLLGIALVAMRNKARRKAA